MLSHTMLLQCNWVLLFIFIFLNKTHEQNLQKSLKVSLQKMLRFYIYIYTFFFLSLLYYSDGHAIGVDGPQHNATGGLAEVESSSVQC